MENLPLRGQCRLPSRRRWVPKPSQKQLSWEPRLVSVWYACGGSFCGQHCSLSLLEENHSVWSNKVWLRAGVWGSDASPPGCLGRNWLWRSWQFLYCKEYFWLPAPTMRRELPGWLWTLKITHELLEILLGKVALRTECWVSWSLTVFNNNVQSGCDLFPH